MSVLAMIASLFYITHWH